MIETDTPRSVTGHAAARLTGRVEVGREMDVADSLGGMEAAIMDIQIVVDLTLTAEGT